ncbi:MAG TPA: NUDIX domain-containing protein [Tepidisphaeraceae bacterium]|jgi:8-oxo-dGTP pyrophosphatase MutT (NUDIX family)|nr:NUDIX domain-containing protein [Tepidisphaeraceae bacterium]
MHLDVRTVLLLRHPDSRQLLLLRRAPNKKLFPDLITGIGGSVELARGEGNDLESSILRELEEETRIRRTDISNLRLRLSTVLSRDIAQVVLLWYTANLAKIPSDLSCTEGALAFFPTQNLPLEQMVPTARQAIPFVASLLDADTQTYNGIYDPATLRLTTNRPAHPPNQATPSVSNS